MPKRLRDAMGLVPGQELDLEVRDGRLEVEVAPVRMTLRSGPHGAVAVPEQEMPPLTADLVRETLENARR